MAKNATEKYNLKHLILTGVRLGTRDLGRGAYARVFTAQYDGAHCAAREIHSILIDTYSKEKFLQECVVHSKLQHPNIVKLLGVYYPSDQAILPVQIMELMEGNLHSLLETSQNIPTSMKSSILQDVSKGLYYLHNLTPPMMHRDLSSKNIVLKSGVAKICDFIVAKVILPDSSDDMLTRYPGTLAFMPPEAVTDNYSLPIDIFSFGCIICHVVSQQYPQPMESSQSTEVEKRQKYLDHIQAGLLKQLVVQCLDDDPAKRPLVSSLCERTTAISASKLQIVAIAKF